MPRKPSKQPRARAPKHRRAKECAAAPGEGPPPVCKPPRVIGNRGELQPETKEILTIFRALWVAEDANLDELAESTRYSRRMFELIIADQREPSLDLVVRLLLTKVPEVVDFMIAVLLR